MRFCVGDVLRPTKPFVQNELKPIKAKLKLKKLLPPNL